MDVGRERGKALVEVWGRFVEKKKKGVASPSGCSPPKKKYNRATQIRRMTKKKSFGVFPNDLKTHFATLSFLKKIPSVSFKKNA
jgi:hypothetical protein